MALVTQLRRAAAALMPRAAHGVGGAVGISTSAHCRNSLHEGAEGEETDVTPVEPVEFDKELPIYMTQLRYTQAAMKAFLESPTDRKKAVGSLVAQFGGKLESFYVTTTGGYDVVMTYTFPKNHDVQSLLFMLEGSGVVSSTQTNKLMRWDDAFHSLMAAKQMKEKYNTPLN